MTTIQEQTRRAADKSSPLFDSGDLETVLSYVGLGHSLFVASVSKWWEDIYSTMGRQDVSVYAENDSINIIFCDSQMTLFSSVFTSPSRVMHAYQNGVDCTSEGYQRAASEHADVVLLAKAHWLGMEYTATVMTVAAECNKLAEVQYLHSQGCPWPPQLLSEAPRSGHFELVRWCYEHECPWDADLAPEHAAGSDNIELMAWVLQQAGTPQLSIDMICAAAVQGNLVMCQYLHSQQCPWDISVMERVALTEHVEVLRWLVDNGCPWDERYLRWYAAHGAA
jgi:hypothetical protein